MLLKQWSNLTNSNLISHANVTHRNEREANAKDFKPWSKLIQFLLSELLIFFLMQINNQFQVKENILLWRKQGRKYKAKFLQSQILLQFCLNNFKSKLHLDSIVLFLFIQSSTSSVHYEHIEVILKALIALIHIIEMRPTHIET